VLNPRTSTVLKYAQSQTPKGSRAGRFALSTIVWIVFVFCIATSAASPAQTFDTLVSFDLTNGADPYYGPLIQGIDGNLYGTTYFGGSQNGICSGLGCGTVFKITADGTVTTLHKFEDTDGAYPEGGLVQATDGNLYGATSSYGAHSYGTVFKITASGDLTTLYNFCSKPNCTDGGAPYAGLIQATDGKLYGVASSGGTGGMGTVFRISTTGELTTLYSFCNICGSGAYPQGALVQATDGNFYGTTSGLNGTVFKITASGDLTTLYNFCSRPNCTDGKAPYAGLIQATDGNFYGTTNSGGASNCVGGCGAVFKITPGGKLTTLHSFCSQSGCHDGAEPLASLVQATDGSFYGATSVGGASVDYGTVFKITAGGTLTTLYSLCSQTGCADGENPYSGLVQTTSGTLYGTTRWGGADSYGTVFSLSTGLGPFVETRPTSGKVGAAVTILGTNLTGATKVSFNGIAAKFKIVSSSEITTTVPTSAKTGTVEVTTPKSTLKSNLAFRVTPQLQSFTPPDGPVGTVVTITGVSLTQTSVVTFDDLKATAFTVESNTEVKATVPTGAKTGKIGITTPGGTATSAGTFTVTP
jgi:uncharacterized repeat protein (TIGR03803 family)